MSALNLDQMYLLSAICVLGGNNSTDLDGIFEEKQSK